jgi:uncharacterized protein
MPMFPLSTVLLPGELLPLHVFEPRYRALVADCLASIEPHFGVVLIARGAEVGGGDTRTDVGTLARIESSSRSQDGRYGLLARGTSRLVVRRWLADDPYPRAIVVVAEDPPVDDDAPRLSAAAAVRRAEALLSELGQPTRGHGGDGKGEEAPWALCGRLPLGPLDRHRLLSTDDPAARLALLSELAEALAGDLEHLLAGG